MRRSLRQASPRKLAASLALSLLVAACADQPLAPSAPASGASLAVTIDRVTDYPDSMAVDFTVDPAGGWFELGPHKIYFPKSSICDPAVSTYGITEWDEPCTPLAKPIQIHAEIRKTLVGNMPAIDFSPALRFVPTMDMNHWVQIYFYTDAVYQPMTEEEARERFKIYWTPGPGLAPIDESLVDPTLRTKVRRQYGYVFRRIEHFSGYQVGAGRLPVDEASW